MHSQEDILNAGKYAHQVRMYGASLIIVGASFNAVVSQIYAKIAELGAIPAFPPQIAINEIAAHFIPAPDEDVIFTDTMVVSLDVGVCVNGAIGDCAISIDLTPDKRYAKLVAASQAAVDEVAKILRVGLPIGEIGKKIEETIQSFGFEPIRNLSGHGLGHYIIHTNPNMPNYNNHNKNTLKAGMHFAIEPFATTGRGMIVEAGDAHIYSFVTKRAVRSPSAKILLKKIESFKGLPFRTHDLIVADMPYFKVKFGLRELVQSGIIHGHPPLVEETKGIVTQAENTFYIDADGVVHKTTQ
jgi:methionyl aminopeptidase